MRITILGCGPSGGVPLIGCDCAVCTSPDPRDRRRRSSILVEEDDTRILIDTSPDLRAQLLDVNATWLTGVVFTHGHADHTHGIDELRAINYLSDAPLDVFCDDVTLSGLRERFGYAFRPMDRIRTWYRPWLVPRVIEGSFTVGCIDVMPFIQSHGRNTTLGLRMGDVAYSTDAGELDEDAFAALDGVGLWIVDCLSPRPNPAHAHLERTLGWIERIRPRRAIITHMSHDFGYAALAASLPEGVEPAWDGMVIDWPRLED